MIINLFIGLLIPCMFGFLLLNLILREFADDYRPLERMALSFALGIGNITIVMFLLARFNIPLTFLNIVIAIILLSIPMLFFAARNKWLNIKNLLNRPKLPQMNWIEWFLFLYITAKMILAYFFALIKPMIDVDAFQQYSIFAKEVYFNHSFNMPYIQQFFGDKPLLPFLAQSWIFMSLNSINDSLVKIIAPTLFLSLLIIFYCALNRTFNRKSALFFTALLSSLPFLAYHITTAYADSLITGFYTIATIYLFLFIKSLASSKKDLSISFLALSFFFLALTVWSKKAGIVLSAINITVLFAYMIIHYKKLVKNNIKRIAILLIIFLVLIAPWLFYRPPTFISHLISSFWGTSLQQAPSSAVQQNVSTESSITIVLQTFARKIFLYADWQLAGVLFIISLMFFYKRAFSPPYYFLLTIIILDLLSVFVQFNSDETFCWLLDGTLLDRLVMTSIPIALYFCAEVILPGWKGNLAENENRASK